VFDRFTESAREVVRTEAARVSGQDTCFLVVAVLNPECSDTIEVVPSHSVATDGGHGPRCGNAEDGAFAVPSPLADRWSDRRCLPPSERGVFPPEVGLLPQVLPKQQA
jgi:hypothetical protein